MSLSESLEDDWSFCEAFLVWLPYKCIYISLLIYGSLLVILLDLNHYNDGTLSVSLIPSVFGVVPSVSSALSSSVFTTNLKRQQRDLCQKVFCLLQPVLFTDQNCLLVGFLLLTGMLGSCELS